MVSANRARCDPLALSTGPCSRIARADTHALERIEVADLVGDRILGHRRERAEDADRAGGGATFGLHRRACEALGETRIEATVGLRKRDEDETETVRNPAEPAGRRRNAP